MCVGGARWVQREVLEKHPDIPLRVYAVWFANFAGDSRDRWPRDLLTDPRVVHIWDEDKQLGRFFGERREALRDRRVTPREPPTPLWDAYLLYGPDARWTETQEDLVSWGFNILDSRAFLLPQTVQTAAGKKGAGR